MEYGIGTLSAMTNVPRETIRRYEKRGYLSAARRKTNGYRVYSAAHIEQVRIARLAFSAYYTRPLRAQTIVILRLSAEGRVQDCLREIQRYVDMIADERRRANLASDALQLLLSGARGGGELRFTRPQAAAQIGASDETVRGWERSGLIGTGGKRYARLRFSENDLRRMRVVQLLVTCGYSMQAVLEALSDGSVLISPEAGKDLVSIKDRWLEALGEAARRAEEMRAAALELQNPPITPQI